VTAEPPGAAGGAGSTAGAACAGSGEVAADGDPGAAGGGEACATGGAVGGVAGWADGRAGEGAGPGAAQAESRAGRPITNRRRCSNAAKVSSSFRPACLTPAGGDRPIHVLYAEAIMPHESTLTATGAHIQRTEGARVIAARFVIAHLAVLGVFFVPFTWQLGLAAFLSYVSRTFVIEGGVHRYFSHRSYKTSRVFQFLLAAAAASNGQRGAIWWAVTHRRHHRHSDQAGDLHSPVRGSVWHAYFGWLIDDEVLATNLDEAPDLAKYPELVWVNKHHYVFTLAGLVGTFLIGQYTPLFGATGMGWAAVVWVFFVAMVASQHMAYAVNAFAHGGQPGLWRARPFATRDQSTNLWWWALPSLGGGWHNNHHRYMNAARAGFFWWQLDPTYWILRVLERLGIVWDLHEVPQAVLQEGRPTEGA
jgi:stearoyl-CoA desaturase (delta-9 desaturase)